MRVVFLTLAAATLVGSIGCAVDDEGLGGDFDATAVDARVDGASLDSGALDTSVADTVTAIDGIVPDTSVMDTFVDDTFVADTFVDDTFVTDTFVADAAEVGDAGPSTACGAPPLANWRVDLVASDGSATVATVRSPFCAGWSTTVTSGTLGPTMQLEEEVELHLVAKADSGGFYDSYGPVLRSTSSGGTTHMELIKIGSVLGAAVDSSHAVIYVFAQARGTGAPCNKRDKLTYSATGVNGVTIQYVIGGVPSVTATETDMSGAAIVIVPTTATASAPLLVNIVGVKTGCDVFNNVGGPTGDVPAVAGATGSALIDVEDQSM